MFGGEEVQDRCKCLWEESFWQQQEITSGIWFIVFYKKKKKTVNAHEKWAYICSIQKQSKDICVINYNSLWSVGNICIFVFPINI